MKIQNYLFILDVALKALLLFFFLSEHTVGQKLIISNCMSPAAKQMGVAPPHWHGRSWLWWSNLTYVPVSYSTWHNPLISGSKGPNLPSVPGLGFRGPPPPQLCPVALSSALPVAMPKSRRWHSNFLSPSQSTPTRVYSEKVLLLCHQRLQTEVERVRLCLFTLFTMWRQSRGECICVRDSNRQHLALNVSLCVSVCVHTLSAHICL